MHGQAPPPDRSAVAGGPDAFSLGHRPPLDGLRAMAVLAVMLGHAAFPWFHGAGVGVEVFFVLSGFLITLLLLEELAARGRVSLRRFYARRALRLLPALAVVVAVCAIVSLITGAPRYARPTLDGVPYVLAYVGNWARAGGRYLGLLDHTWSLSIEEQFYLLWPPILVAMAMVWRGAAVRRMLAVTLAAAAASVAARVFVWHGPSSLARLRDGTDTRAVALLLGCALAMALHQSTAEGRQKVASLARWAVWPAAAFLTVLAVVQKDKTLIVGPEFVPLAAIFATVTIADLITRPDSALARFLSLRPLVTVGKVSYGLYLWHVPVFLLVHTHLSFRIRGATWVKFALTGVVTAASYLVVERPALRLKRRFSVADPAPYDPAPPPGATAVGSSSSSS